MKSMTPEEVEALTEDVMRDLRDWIYGQPGGGYYGRKLPFSSPRGDEKKEDES